MNLPFCNYFSVISVPTFPQVYKYTRIHLQYTEGGTKELKHENKEANTNTVRESHR